MSYKFFALNRKENYSNKRSQKLNAPRESILIHCQSTVCRDSGHFEETNRQQCDNLSRDFPTNGFKCSSPATYEHVSYMSFFFFFSLRLCFTRFLVWFFEGFKLVLIVVGSVRTFIFHNIHHRASWIMQKLQCVSNIYNSSPSHWWKLTCESRRLKITLDMRQFTWISHLITKVLFASENCPISELLLSLLFLLREYIFPLKVMQFSCQLTLLTAVCLLNEDD